MTDKKLLTIIGGATISGTLINSIAKIINTFLELGRIIGSAIKYWQNGTKC